jgi:hypothetical protein
MTTNRPQFTLEQYATLGALVARWTHDASNRFHIHVTPEIGRGRTPPTMLCRITDTSGDGGAVTLTHGIEPDGYCHT